jgi:hypothetical protein
MSWILEIPEGQHFQLRPQFNYIEVEDSLEYVSGFQNGVVNGDGDVIVSGTLNGEPIQINKTMKDDGSADFSYSIGEGTLKLKFIFPDEVSDKNLNFYPPAKQTSVIYETFSDNSFDNPWSNVLPDVLSNIHIGMMTPSELIKNDILDISSFLNEKLSASFEFGVTDLSDPARDDNYYSYSRSIPVSGVSFENLWVSVMPELMAGFGEIRPQSNYIYYINFHLAFCKTGIDWEGALGYGGIAFDLANLSKILSDEIENPKNWMSGEPYWDVRKVDNLIAVKGWPLSEDGLWGGTNFPARSFGNIDVSATDEPEYAVLLISCGYAVF